MDYLTFYNNEGAPIAWVSRDQRSRSVFLFNGKPVAWISSDSIYSYSGKHLGWMLDGWVRDHEGKAVFFTQDAIGGPPRPSTQVRPIREPRGVKPARGAKEPRPSRPLKSTFWSQISDDTFFD